MPKDDRKSIDLGQQQTKQKDGLKIQSPLKSSTNAKRNIVDTFLHTSCMFGHDPTLGLGFSYTWEVGVKGLMKGWMALWSVDYARRAMACHPVSSLRWSVFFSVSE